MKIVEDIRKASGLSLKENKESLIEIHPEILQKKFKVPLICKGMFLFQKLIFPPFIIDRGRIGYLLKKSRPLRVNRKTSKEYKSSLQILKRASIDRASNKADSNTQLEEEKHDEADMNVD